MLAEVDPTRSQEVRATLEGRGFTISQQAFNFLLVRSVPLGQIESLSTIPGVNLVHYNRPVRATSLPPLPPFVMNDPLLGEYGIDDVVAPMKLRARPDLLLPLSPLKILNLSEYQFIPSIETRNRVLDVPTNLDGRGVKVAVLDTGSPSPLNPMNLFRIRPFSASFEIFPGDGVGHGTWCLTEIGGQAWPTIYGISMGIAPGAEMYSIKVLSSTGMGSTFEVLKGMELAVALGVKIVSMSLGSEPQGGCAEDPVCRGVAILAKQKVIPIVAAGNSGPNPSTMDSPGISPNAVTVGSWGILDNAVSWFSSRGPTKDGLVKPDVCSYGGGRVKQDTRPNELIVNACEGWLDAMYDGLLEGFGGLMGTSMACPTFAGLVALAEQDRNNRGTTLTVQAVHDLLARRGEEKSNDAGWGLGKLSWLLA